MYRLRRLWLPGVILVLATALLASFGCGGDGGAGGDGGDGAGVNFQPEKKISGIRSEPVTVAGDGVTSLTFSPDGRLFLTEQGGDVRIVTTQGELLPEPFADVDVARNQEWGLLGIAIDPEFEENGYVYIYFIQPVGPGPAVARPVVMRFTDANNKGIDPTVLIEFPLANSDSPFHVGGGLQFGPDGYLYLSIGDTQRPELSQDLSSPFGKMLRFTRDGDAAPDNPFVDEPGADPRVYAYGLRNTFGFTFHPENGLIYANDNGDLNCDELNIIEAGKNYGWPQSRDTGGGLCQNPGGVEPIYHYSLPGIKPEELGTAVPAGIRYVSGQVYPALGDGLLACEFKTQFMRRLQLAGPNRDQVSDDSVVVEGCNVAVTTDPQGVVYYSIGSGVGRLPPQ